MIEEMCISPTGRYSRKEVSELLGCSVRTVARYMADGLIRTRYYERNGRPYFRGSDVMKLAR